MAGWELASEPMSPFFGDFTGVAVSWGIPQCANGMACSGQTFGREEEAATTLAKGLVAVGIEAAFAGKDLAIPSFFEIKESDGVRKLSEKNRILFFRSPR